MYIDYYANNAGYRYLPKGMGDGGTTFRVRANK
jgi:hypothetical protein